jgi:ABC-type antimicrobial peptide transport system permease subunit
MADRTRCSQGIARQIQRVVQTVDPQLPFNDPGTFMMTAALVLIAAGTAALVPSLRILRLNVIAALRQT